MEIISTNWHNTHCTKICVSLIKTIYNTVFIISPLKMLMSCFLIMISITFSSVNIY